MLKVKIERGTIAQVDGGHGDVRWYRICGGCGDMAEIQEPKNPDTATTFCEVCYEERFAESDRREQAQENHDYWRAVGVQT